MEYKIRTHQWTGKGIVEQMRTLPGNRIVYMGDPPNASTPDHFFRTTVADVLLVQTALGDKFNAVRRLHE